MIMHRFIRLRYIAVAPRLEQALGYPGEVRWVAFWWDTGGDTPRYHDGRDECTGCWYAWIMLVEHPRVAPYLGACQIGDSDTEARHWLLLDRLDRVLYAGEAERVLHFLTESAAGARALRPQCADAAQGIEQELAEVGALTAWLNAGCCAAATEESVRH